MVVYYNMFCNMTVFLLNHCLIMSLRQNSTFVRHVKLIAIQVPMKQLSFIITKNMNIEHTISQILQKWTFIHKQKNCQFTKTGVFMALKFFFFSKIFINNCNVF